jgi:hypothetical protein
MLSYIENILQTWARCLHVRTTLDIPYNDYELSPKVPMPITFDGSPASAQTKTSFLKGVSFKIQKKIGLSIESTKIMTPTW